MINKGQKSLKFWQEIKRRKVPRTLAIYAGTAFIILEAADIIFPRWGFPDWSVDLVLYLLIVGAVIVTIVSWIYDLTPGGIVKTKSYGSVEEDKDTSLSANKRLWTSNIIIAVLILVIGFLVYPKIFKGDNSPLRGATRSIIAVLPLKTIGSDMELSYFASGLVETLSHMLSKVGNTKQSFSVIPPSEIIGAITAKEARKMFGASLVISGSIQMDQSSSRLILNLIDAKKQNLIRSEKLDYPKDKDLIIQDEIISVMVSMLGLELESETKDQITRGGSNSKEANEFYLIGRGILREGIETVQDIDEALELFHLAIQKDSLFALAYSGIGQSYTVKYHFTLDDKWNDESLKYSRKAVELNDQDPYALISLAGALVEKGTYKEALIYYEKSKELDSSNAQIYNELGYLYEMDGKYNEAEANNIKAVEIDPESHLTHYYLGAFYHARGRYEEAIAEIEKALEYSPGHLTILHALGSCYWAIENFEDAIVVFEDIIEKDSTHGRVLWNLGSIYYYKGEFERSIQYYQKALKYTPQNYNLHGALARAYYWSDEQSQAIEVLRNAISIAKRNSSGSFLDIATYYGLMGMTDSADYYIEMFDPSDNPEELDATSAFHLGELYLILEREPLAYKYIESGLKKGYGWIEVRHSPYYKRLKHDHDFQEMIARSAESEK